MAELCFFMTRQPSATTHDAWSRTYQGKVSAGMNGPWIGSRTVLVDVQQSGVLETASGVAPAGPPTSDPKASRFGSVARTVIY